jgi:hypothetical protein
MKHRINVRPKDSASSTGTNAHHKCTADLQLSDETFIAPRSQRSSPVGMSTASALRNRVADSAIIIVAEANKSEMHIERVRHGVRGALWLIG